MSSCRLIFPVLLAGILALTALAQSVPSPLPPVGENPPSTEKHRSTKHPRKEPCWQVAGISKAAMEQRHALANQVRQEVEAVCANSSLTLRQKHEQIRALHEREKQQANALVTPPQEQALKACQESRGKGGHDFGGGGGGRRGAGPCGEMPRPKSTLPESTRED
jgi:hypothetical protein